MVISLLACLLALGGTASAAIVTYKLTFFDDRGAKFGSGVVKFDPDVKRLLIVGGRRGGGELELCHPPLPIELAREVCGTELHWTPVDLSLEFPLFYGSGSTFNDFLEGEIDFAKSGFEVVRPNSWSSFDGIDGSGFRIFFLSDLFGPAGRAHFEFVGPDDRGEFLVFDGSVVSRLQEVPLPGAFGLFLAGIAGAAGFSRSRISRDRQTTAK
ncbi:MAG: hypothetical protein ACK4NP_05175 [Parvularculaceae bacterium]